VTRTPLHGTSPAAGASWLERRLATSLLTTSSADSEAILLDLLEMFDGSHFGPLSVGRVREQHR